MYTGPPASRKVVDEFGGSTLHRRNVAVGPLVIDFHVRLSAFEMGSPQFGSPEFLRALGAELGGVDSAIYEEFLESFIKSAKVAMLGRPLTKVPVLFMFGREQDTDMYRTVAESRYFGLLRYMMCKL